MWDTVKSIAPKYRLDPDKDIIQTKTYKQPVTQKVVNDIKKCNKMLQVYDSDEPGEHFTWLFFEYAIAKVLGLEIVRIVEKQYEENINIDREIPPIQFDRKSRDKNPIEKAIEEALEALHKEED